MSKRYKFQNRKYKDFNKFERERREVNNYGPKNYNYNSYCNNDYNNNYYDKYNNNYHKRNYNYNNKYNDNYNNYENYNGNRYKRGRYSNRKFFREVEIGEKNEIDEKFVEELKKIGYFIREVKGDGNCLFRSVSEQLEENENNYEVYRKKCIDYMKENKDAFKPFLEDEEPIDDYIEKIGKNGEWGGNLEIYALSMALKSNFYIYMHEQPIYVINNWKDPINNIMLTYHNGKHYNSLRKLEEKNNEDKEKEEKRQKSKDKDEDKEKEERDNNNGSNEKDEDLKVDNDKKEEKKKMEEINDLMSKVNHLNI